jgi:ribosomal protein S9
MDAKVRGGGIAGQLDAVKYGIARALQKQDPEFRHTLKPGALPIW